MRLATIQFPFLSYFVIDYFLDVAMVTCHYIEEIGQKNSFNTRALLPSARKKVDRKHSEYFELLVAQNDAVPQPTPHGTRLVI